MKKERSLSIVILVASLLLAVTLIHTWILYTQTHSQTRQSGAYQLESASGRLESTISDAKNLTMQLAIEAREYLEDQDSLKDFIYKRKEKLLAEGIGAFNLYIAGKDFCFIPDFDMPEDYIATDRVWYTGAVRNGGKAYVSSPYQDAMTGEICYTVSVMLGDGETVLAVDYTMERIRDYIVQVSDDAINAVIVTDEGVIAGCSDESLVGEKLEDTIPDYAGIYNSAKNRNEVVSGRVKDGLFFENLFAAQSSGGWIFIVSISDWELYKSAYIQLLVTIVLSLALFSIIIILYMGTMKSREKAERALRSREEFLSRITLEFADPLKSILSYSSRESLDRTEDYEEAMARIHSQGTRLSEMLSQIMSYKSIVLVGDKASKREKTGGLNKRFRALVLAVLFAVMLVSLYTNISSAYTMGNARMKGVASEYAFHLSEWVATQKSILDMFASTLSTNPGMLSDYEATVAWLDRITRQYPEISVTYMTNPALPHTVYMSNGWEPDADWHVEERRWYIDTLSSREGWSISAPYFDEQTGGYCVTFSKIVYDSESGDFLGVFGIDFFMDKLVNILGGSYTETGYAFLVDPEGEIINHPYGVYQMRRDSVTNISSLPYGEIRADGETTAVFRDYDGEFRTLIAVRNDITGFSVYAVSGVWNIYGRAIIYGVVCVLAFIFCMVLVYRLLTNLIRWQEKTNRELKESADAAISAGKAKSSFLAQMSHEIRTPINAVLGMNEMILRESGDASIREYAANIQSSGRTLLSLINSILDFSKIEDGKMELVLVKYDLSSMINDLVNSISERARNKGLDFVLEVDSSLPCTLFGDDVRIRQVIMNLLTNAVKYTEKGKVTLVITGKKMPDNKLLMFVSVRDTGIGIRKEDMEKLFESFARLDEEKNRNIEGTGLGMSIVTRLLDLMGTSLKVESEYGHGSEFSFELTQEIINADPIGDFMDRLKKSVDRTEEEKYLFAHDVSILVVDDNDMNRKVARSLMKRNGIVPDEAASGEDAVEMIAAKAYDIVFLDHMMPKMDGVETLKRLKERNLIRQGCTVIALTANAVSGARERYLENGFDDYLSKPIEVTQLERKLATWLPAEKITWKTTGTAGENASKTRVEEKRSEKLSDTVLEFDPCPDPQDDVTESGPAASKALMKSEPAAPEVFVEFEPASSDAVVEFEPAASDTVVEFEPDASDAVVEFEPDASDAVVEFEPDAPLEYEAVKEPQTADVLTARLKKLGIDVEAARRYCGNNDDFYLELVEDYVKSCPDKLAELDHYYDSAKWHDFEVNIHALKSISRTIGAMMLYEKALALEEAAEKGDVDFIRSSYPVFRTDYQELSKAMQAAMGLA